MTDSEANGTEPEEEPIVASVETPTDPGVGVPTGCWGGLRRRLRPRRRLCGLALGAYVAYRAVEWVLDIRPTGAVARIALLPVRAAGCVEYAAVLLAPAACATALHTWHNLDLPGNQSSAGRRVERVIKWFLVASLVFMVAMAFNGDVIVRYALVFYAPASVAAWVRISPWCTGLRRFLQTWFLFGPLIFEYRVLWLWAKHTTLAQDEEVAAFSRLHAKYAPRVFDLLVELGGIFVKIGQLLSLLPAGVLPDPFTAELKKLQCEVPPRPGPEVRALIAASLGRPVEAVFSRFDDKPLGSASIGQVHRARLASDGREVVVKVQYSEVRRTLEPDFRNAERIVWLLDRTRVEEVREAKKHYLDELDFEMEARTLQRIHSNLSGPFPAVRVPEPVVELCTPTILVMTFISGTSLLDGIMHMAEALAKAMGKSVDTLIKEAAASMAQPEESPTAPGAGTADAAPVMGPPPRVRKRDKIRAKIASALPTVPDAAKVRLLQHCLSTSRSALNVGVAVYNHSVVRLGATPLQYWKVLPSIDPVKLSFQLWRIHGHQLLIDGIFSTDPHPGNILLDSRGSVGLIDFGQVCELSLQTRLAFAHLLLALAADCDDEIATWHAALGMRSRSMTPELLAASARWKFGDVKVFSVRNYERFKEMEAKDPVLTHRGDGGLGRVERLVNILRGTSLILGVPREHGPTTVWLDLARDLLEAHGEQIAIPSASRRDSAISVLIPEDIIEEEEFFDVKSDEGSSAAGSGVNSPRPSEFVHSPESVAGGAGGLAQGILRPHWLPSS